MSEADELQIARETIRRLNRRVQAAEAGLKERLKHYVPGQSGPSWGRNMVNALALIYVRERDDLRMTLAEVANLLAQPGQVEAARALIAKKLTEFRGEPIHS